MSSPTSPNTLYYVDIGELDPKTFVGSTWLPGVPCLVSSGNVHLGIDAFCKCRELMRTPVGIRFEQYTATR